MTNMDAQSKDLDIFYQKPTKSISFPVESDGQAAATAPQTKVLPYLWHWADLRRMATARASLCHRTRRRLFRGPVLAWHEFVNESKDELILFSVQDTPVMQALGLYREKLTRTTAATSRSQESSRIRQFGRITTGEILTMQ